MLSANPPICALAMSTHRVVKTAEAVLAKVSGVAHFASPSGAVLTASRTCARDTTNSVYSLQLPFKPAQKLAPAGGGGPPPGMPQPPPGMAGAPPPPPPPFQVRRLCLRLCVTRRDCVTVGSAGRSKTPLALAPTAYALARGLPRLWHAGAAAGCG